MLEALLFAFYITVATSMAATRWRAGRTDAKQ